jgi:hypothetical protein
VINQQKGPGRVGECDRVAVFNTSDISLEDDFGAQGQTLKERRERSTRAKALR